MSLLLESIKILNGKVYNLSLHEQRANRSRKMLLGMDKPIGFKKSLWIPEEFKKGLVKCRVMYGENIEAVSFSNYDKRKINSAKVIFTDHIHYDHKYVLRAELDDLYTKREHHDEIIIIKNGMVTDAYYFNLVFEREGKYFTSNTPLLQGIQREKLIQAKKIQVVSISVDDIQAYECVHFINALNPLGKCVIDVESIAYSTQGDYVFLPRGLNPLK
jgi:4-amino-4-deoxychorismate lyase